MPLKNTTFTIFDFETTGLYPYSGDKICEIGAIRMEPGGGKQIRFHSMVDPERAVSDGAFAVNGITENMLKGAPTIDQILPDFIKFIEKSVLVAYNAGFDLGFLEYALGEDKSILNDYAVVDALVLARRLFPGIGRYNLANVARSLGIRSSSREHRAMSDANMTLRIFQKELDILLSYGARSVEDIARVRGPAPVKTVKDYRHRLIEKAIREQKKLNITYRSIWSNRITKRTITPKEIQRGYDKSYVIAHCHTKGAERNFRLDGILEAEPEE